MTLRDNAPYELLPQDPERAARIGARCDLGAAAAQVLAHRGFDEEDAPAFLDPRLDALSDPTEMADREVAAKRLADACRAGERVAIFGDYDVDGTTSAAIMADVLEELGASVHPFVANRFEGGYGFSEPALDRCLGAKPSVIVTCDCGSADHPRVARAVATGVDVIVVDHHLVPDEPLPALAFLNPHRPDCGFPYKGLCSAGLALFLAAAIRAELGAKLDVRRWLDLVALGTVADVAPLTGDNRSLVRAGLKLLAHDRVRPGVQALRERAGIRPRQPMGAHEIAFRLAPRLNAAGRLGDPTITLQLLRAKTIEQARELAGRIEDINDERKAVERRTTEEAIAQVIEIYGDAPEHGVVVAGHGWHRGVVGITAARLVDRFDVPAVVIALDSANEHGVSEGHGSGRTPDGFDLHAALSQCDEYFTRFGGHAAAAGVTMLSSELDAFRARFSQVAPRPEANLAPPQVDVELNAETALPSVQDLMRLEPLGEANAQPVFALPELVVDDVRTVMDGQHLKLRLRHGRTVLTAFGRDLAHRADSIGKRVTIVGTLRPDNWRGGGALELSVERLYD